MKTLTNAQIRSAIKPTYPQDKIYITQDFGNYNTVYAGSRHLGVDIRVFDRMFGEPVRFCFSGTVFNVGYFDRIGWGVDVDSDVFTVDGVEFYLRATYLHTRKPTITKGQRVEQGQEFAKAGIILQLNSYWSGQHTHFEFMPYYKQVNGGFQTDYTNGYSGRIDPIDLIEGLVADYEGKDVKTADEFFVYKIEGGKKRLYEDEVVYSSHGRFFPRDLQIISGALMEKIPRGTDMPLNKVGDTALVVKQLTGLFANDPSRGRLLNDKHYK